jgi:hypothetical protein
VLRVPDELIGEYFVLWLAAHLITHKSIFAQHLPGSRVRGPGAGTTDRSAENKAYGG